MYESGEGLLRCKMCSIKIPEESIPVWKKHRLLFIMAATLLFALAIGIEYFGRDVLSSHIIFLAIILLSGQEIIRTAFRSLLDKRQTSTF